MEGTLTICMFCSIACWFMKKKLEKKRGMKIVTIYLSSAGLFTSTFVVFFLFYLGCEGDRFCWLSAPEHNNINTCTSKRNPHKDDQKLYFFLLPCTLTLTPPFPFLLSSPLLPFFFLKKTTTLFLPQPLQSNQLIFIFLDTSQDKKNRH